MKAKLTPKQQQFCDEYLIDLNATQAAIRAGYSKKTANEQGSRLLANVNIQKAIKTTIDKRKEQVAVTQNDVLTQLAKMGFRAFNDAEITPKDALKALELICRLMGFDSTSAKAETEPSTLLAALEGEDGNDDI